MGNLEMPPPPAYNLQPLPQKYQTQTCDCNAAVEEMIHRAATAPSFSEELPDRDKSTESRRWKIATFILIGLVTVLLAVIIFLAAWAGRMKNRVESSNLAVADQSSPLEATVTSTAITTAISSTIMTATTTMWNTSTSYETLTWTREVPVTFTVIGTTTNMAAETPTTGCDPGPISIAPNFCVLRSNCDSLADSKLNDCVGLCRTNLCKGDKSSLGQRATQCCGHCGCFE